MARSQTCCFSWSTKMKNFIRTKKNVKQNCQTNCPNQKKKFLCLMILRSLGVFLLQNSRKLPFFVIVFIFDLWVNFEASELPDVDKNWTFHLCGIQEEGQPFFHPKKEALMYKIEVLRRENRNNFLNVLCVPHWPYFDAVKGL